MPISSLRLRVLLSVLLVLGVVACANPDTRSESTAPDLDGPPEPPSFFLGGIQVNEDSLDSWFDALEKSGMNTISVTDYARQGRWDSAHLWFEDNPGMIDEIRGAKARGMAAVLILRVALDHAYEENRFLWHGMIMPNTDAQLEEWFDQYRQFVLNWARIAEREGVDVLMIGSEYNALASTVPLSELPPLEEYYLNGAKQQRRKAQTLAYEGKIPDEHFWKPGQDGYETIEEYLDARIAREQTWAAQTALTAPVDNGDDPSAPDSGIHADARALARINARRLRLEERWRGLIADVREVYSGQLGYAANFDQYYHVSFWDALDILGINAYFEIRKRYLPENARTAEALYPLLEDGWTAALDEIATFRQANGLDDKPVLFSELGYTYRANSTLKPWADTGYGLIPPEDGEGDDQVVVWREQPVDLEERALAVRALYDAHAKLENPFLNGLLYWKLSTVPSHPEVESFVLMLENAEKDPLVEELQRFVR